MKKAGAIVISLFVALSFSNVPSRVYANGAAWHSGANVGKPGPTKQTDLYLKKEHVVFEPDKITAKFWVFNPTNTPIVTPMGFPVDHQFYKDEQTAEFAEEFSRAVMVQVNGQNIDFQTESNNGGEYPVVIRWEMIFPPNSTTDFIVIYPMNNSWFAGDGLGEDLLFKYITHTGAYWAKPIEEAIFELRSRRFVELISKYPPGRYWKYESENVNEVIDLSEIADVNIDWKINPKPTRIDLESGVVHWKMVNWTPIKGQDDIQVTASYRYGEYGPWVDGSGYRHDGGTFWELCKGNTYGDGSNPSGHFGAFIHADKILLKEESFPEILQKSFNYPSLDPEDVPPPHYKLSHALLTIRYMRNYLYALHNYQFKDKDLADCFSNVHGSDKPFTTVENKNLKFLLKAEKELKPRELVVRQSIERRLIPENVFDAMSGF